MRQLEVVVQLPPHEHRHLEAALAWVELGAYVAANDDLDEIAPELRADPEVRIVRAKVYNGVGRHLDAATIAQAVVRARPDEESVWLCVPESMLGNEIRTGTHWPFPIVVVTGYTP